MGKISSRQPTLININRRLALLWIVCDLLGLYFQSSLEFGLRTLLTLPIDIFKAFWLLCFDTLITSLRHLLFSSILWSLSIYFVFLRVHSGPFELLLFLIWERRRGCLVSWFLSRFFLFCGAIYFKDVTWQSWWFSFFYLRNLLAFTSTYRTYLTVLAFPILLPTFWRILSRGVPPTTNGPILQIVDLANFWRLMRLNLGVNFGWWVSHNYWRLRLVGLGTWAKASIFIGYFGIIGFRVKQCLPKVFFGPFLNGAFCFSALSHGIVWIGG